MSETVSVGYEVLGVEPVLGAGPGRPPPDHPGGPGGPQAAGGGRGISRRRARRMKIAQGYPARPRPQAAFAKSQHFREIEG